MHVRIPVVISQSDRRVGSIAEYEEQLITQLMFESGLDATLISDLKSIQPDTTDHLCIEGLKGDFALASWESAKSVLDHLNRLGLHSLVIIPVDGGDRSERIESGVLPKKIFFVPLSVSTPIHITIRQLQELRESRSIPVVSLGWKAAPVTQRVAELVKPGTHLPIVSEIPPKNTSKSQSRSDADAPVRTHSPGDLLPKPNLPLSHSEPSRTDDEDDFPELDGLMDDLDKFEI